MDVVRIHLSVRWGRLWLRHADLGGISGFTNVYLGPFGIDLGFFCSYHYPGAHDNAVRAASLSAATGGALALCGVTEIRVALDIDVCAVILGASTGGRWSFRTGPDLVADQSVAAGTALMTWSVADLDAAAAVLAGLGARRAGTVFTIEALGGLEKVVGMADLLGGHGLAAGPGDVWPGASMAVIRFCFIQWWNSWSW